MRFHTRKLTASSLYINDLRATYSEPVGTQPSQSQEVVAHLSLFRDIPLVPLSASRVVVLSQGLPES